MFLRDKIHYDEETESGVGGGIPGQNAGTQFSNNNIYIGQNGF